MDVSYGAHRLPHKHMRTSSCRQQRTGRGWGGGGGGGGIARGSRSRKGMLLLSVGFAGNVINDWFANATTPPPPPPLQNFLEKLVGPHVASSHNEFTCSRQTGGMAMLQASASFTHSCPSRPLAMPEKGLRC